MANSALRLLDKQRAAWRTSPHILIQCAKPERGETKLSFRGGGIVILTATSPTLGSAPSYPVIQPTMIQASVAMTTLPAKTSGKNSPQLRLRQGAAEGSEVGEFK